MKVYIVLWHPWEEGNSTVIGVFTDPAQAHEAEEGSFKIGGWTDIEERILDES